MRRMFPGVTLEPEDMYLLEPFQISYLPGWVPEAPLASLLIERPGIEAFMKKRYPPISDFIDRIKIENPRSGSSEDPPGSAQTVLWTLADLLVYSKCPRVYDSLDFHGWDFSQVTSITSLKGMTVIDAGAGTGRVAFEAALHAKAVFAVEPVGRLRDFMREKAEERGVCNLHVIDGFLHRLPMPDGFAHVLLTSHALGWVLEKELPEMERVVRPGGHIIHCPGTSISEGDSEVHLALVSRDYSFSVYAESDGDKRKYWKKLPPDSCASAHAGI
jgi:SAM-dependent methyltransferase